MRGPWPSHKRNDCRWTLRRRRGGRPAIAVRSSGPAARSNTIAPAQPFTTWRQAVGSLLDAAGQGLGKCAPGGSDDRHGRVVHQPMRATLAGAVLAHHEILERSPRPSAPGRMEILSLEQGHVVSTVPDHLGIADWGQAGCNRDRLIPASEGTPYQDSAMITPGTSHVPGATLGAAWLAPRGRKFIVPPRGPPGSAAQRCAGRTGESRAAGRCRKLGRGRAGHRGFVEGFHVVDHLRNSAARFATSEI